MAISGQTFWIFPVRLNPKSEVELANGRRRSNALRVTDPRSASPANTLVRTGAPAKNENGYLPRVRRFQAGGGGAASFPARNFFAQSGQIPCVNFAVVRWET